MGKKKLDIYDRMTLQGCIAKKYSINKIAKILGFNKSNLYREIIRNSKVKDGCKTKCTQLLYSYLCNGCSKTYYCQREKHYYDYKYADELTYNRLRQSRSSPKIHESSIKIIDEIVSRGVKLGQSLHHIYVANPNLRKLCSERTIRRLCYRGNLSIRPYELRRYVTYKREYTKEGKNIGIRDIKELVGRTFKDYKRKTGSNKKLNIVQYDSVIGKTNDKYAILTITFPKYNFQFGRLIQKGNSVSVNNAVRAIFEIIGTEKVKEIFPINLCDNGSEFAVFYRLKFDSNGEKICNTYYTNPYKATDKSECERCHEFVRYCIPKSKSLDGITQAKLDDMFSNINSYIRKSLNDKTPYDLVLKKYGKEFLDAIGIYRVDTKKIKLQSIV